MLGIYIAECVGGLYLGGMLGFGILLWLNGGTL